ncbi:MAG: hypothetical protein IJ559_07490 [Prevotella sp.]|nr:hypothetical protein [Prevotella sp.]
MKKEEYKDQGLRQALQRRNESAERMTLPEDFTDRLMQRLEEPTPTLPKGGRNKSLLYWGRLVGASIAASVVLLLTFHFINNKEVTKVEQPIVVKKTESQRSEPNAIKKEPIQMAKEEKAVVAKTTMINKRSKASVSESKTSTTVAATDSLDYYIDKIERELAQVDESLYIERMNKVIRADERLQRIVNSYILHTLDKEGRPQTADNMYNVKTEEDEE